jgi:outer membrane receptor protein involved in Fe transport
MKGDALERTISFDMSAYYLRWSNIQTLFYLPTCGRNYIQNAGNASSRGFDVSATIRPNSSFTLGVALGYNQGRYDSNVSVASATLVHKGDRLPGSPLTVNVSARNEFPIGDNILYVSGSYDYRSRYARPQIWSNSDNYSYDPYKIVPEEDNNISLRAGIKVDNRIDASVFVTNLLDTHPALADYHPNRTDPLLIYYTSRPRTFGLTLSYRQ